MAMIPTHHHDLLADLFTRRAFEEHAVKLTPALPLGEVKINGLFDRYFHPETQAWWEGFNEARMRTQNVLNKLRLDEWKWQPRERMLIAINTDHLQVLDEY